ncbi:hypothetical protein M758_UG002300 [Ceratodon purpureus]|nr:hypothetical protein M758_UG002300 [Ceratodon purpureus]
MMTTTTIKLSNRDRQRGATMSHILLGTESSIGITTPTQRWIEDLCRCTFDCPSSSIPYLRLHCPGRASTGSPRPKIVHGRGKSKSSCKSISTMGANGRVPQRTGHRVGANGKITSGPAQTTSRRGNLQ